MSSLSFSRTHLFARVAPLGALFVFACSSSDEDAAPLDAADASANEAGVGAKDAGEDADAGSGDGAADATLPPPTYDFAVACAGTPCAKRVAARGGSHACAVFQDGSVRCWGANDAGQLGTGATDAGPMPAFSPSPRAVSGISSAEGVAAVGEGTSGSTCIVATTGTISCFGSNAWGQLGRGGPTSNGPHPEALVIDGFQAKSITLANTFVLAVGTDDQVWSWGSNDALQLARDPKASSDAGDADLDPTSPARAGRLASPVRSLGGTTSNGFAVTEAGTVLSWGRSVDSQLARSSSLVVDPIPTTVALSDITSIATGAAHACALGRGGGVHCWGANDHGQLGAGIKGSQQLPAPVLLPAGVQAVAVSAGGDDTCIIAANGDVLCWGANQSGQMGIAAREDQPLPVRINGVGEPAVSVAIMEGAVCALRRGGTVVCWGDNLAGQLGRGTRDQDIHVEPAPIVVE